MTTTQGFAHLSDAEVLARVKQLADEERDRTAALVRLLCEVEARRLHLAAGCSSLFTYCTQILRLAEPAAYLRMAAADVARQFPVVLDLLERGDVTLSTIKLVRPVLTADNHVELLEAVRGKSKREVEAIVAGIRPQREFPTLIRAIGGGRYEMRLVISEETLTRLERAQDLMRHIVPDGDEALILDRALMVLIADLEKKKFAATDRPRPVIDPVLDSRHIPAFVKQAVRLRDGDRCAFIGTEGRCTETGGLEFHHALPFGAGGQATIDNIELRCRAHNRYEAERWFGPLVVRERRPEWDVLN